MTFDPKAKPPPPINRATRPVISVGPEIYDRVTTEAAARGLARSEFCRQAIQYALDHMEDEI